MARPRSETAHRKVLDAAVALIAEVGVDGFTVDAVAARSGVAKTTIYRHWQSGDALLVGALACNIEQLATPNTGSLRGDLIALYRSVMAMLDQPQVFRTMLGVLGRAASDPDFNELKQQFEHERDQPVRTVLELANARGELRTDTDLGLLVDFIVGPIAARRLMKLGTFTDGEIEQIVDLLLVGLCRH